MIKKPLPRYVIDKPRDDGTVSYYFNVPTYYRKLGCPVENAPLGIDYIKACGVDGHGGLAESLNARIDEWNDARKGLPVTGIAAFATVDWLFREYKASKAYLEKVAPRSRPDYERTMQLVADILNKKGHRIGSLPVKSISPAAADKLYDKIIVTWRATKTRDDGSDASRMREVIVDYMSEEPEEGQHLDVKTRAAKECKDVAIVEAGEQSFTFTASGKTIKLAFEEVAEIVERGWRLRQGEKAIKLCSKAWRVVRRLYPDAFDDKHLDPWAGVALKRRKKKEKRAVTREQVYQFAWGCIELGQPEPAAAAVICFEWLQRPENVLAGKIRWTDYRSREHPTRIHIEHHKTGAQVWHPLEDETPEGIVRFYDEAEAVLAKLPKRGIPMVLREVTPSKRSKEPAYSKLYSFSGFEKKIQILRKKVGLPEHFTLDACRHGGMTELEEAGLTDGQGRALSAHTSDAYNRYAKRTEDRVLAATRKRHAHVLADRAPDEARTEFQKEGRNEFQNGPDDQTGNAV